MKSQDHFWTDPPADELVQRHKLSSGVSSALNGPPTPLADKRPGLQYKRDSRMSGSSEEGSRSVAKDYVESLHQNPKSTLLYGKNNVFIQPREHLGPMPGYLSLHQVPDALILNWTPNELMNGMNNSLESTTSDDKSIYWDYAVNVSIDDVVYLHCHQNENTEGTVVLVGQDGVQQPPIHFPRGGHLLTFLSCLEHGLLPHGQMDPPLWSLRGHGKVFPKLRRKGRDSLKKCIQEHKEEKGEANDYVFRIITSFKRENILKKILDEKEPHCNLSWYNKDCSSPKYFKHNSSSSTSTNSSCKSTEENSNDVFKTPCFFDKPLKGTVVSGLSIQHVCTSMKKQIISRAFYGWLAHCRHLCTVRTHLPGLVHPYPIDIMDPIDASMGVTPENWTFFCDSSKGDSSMEIFRLTYFGGVQHSIRKQVWPYLLGHYTFGSTLSERQTHDNDVHICYETTMSEWLAVEAIVKQKDQEIMAANFAKMSSESANSEIPLVGPKDICLSNEVFEEQTCGESLDYHKIVNTPVVPEENLTDNEATRKLEPMIQENSSLENQESQEEFINDTQLENQRVVPTNLSVDFNICVSEHGKHQKLITNEADADQVLQSTNEEIYKPASEVDSSCVSPASSGGGVYSAEFLNQFSLNLHRIDKDVQRCDRNYWYFTIENLEKLRNIMCTYVWQNLDSGYVQGMCDIVAPLLVIFDDEVLTHSCFCELMKRMVSNFPYGGAMDEHLANMRSLIQILDSEMFELMRQNGDYTHFYFCYRWFLLDFKRELRYEDVFTVWETIWAAKHVASTHFVVFIALAMVEFYRDIILENNMDFTDIIKFFNEMAERHDAKAILKIARNLVQKIQTLIENK